jgi:hypothetical protein
VIVYLIAGSAAAAAALGLILVRRGVRRRSRPASRRYEARTPFQPGFDTSRQVVARRQRPASDYGLRPTEPVRDRFGEQPAGHL